jgi:hypothetical protein
LIKLFSLLDIKIEKYILPLFLLMDFCIRFLFKGNSTTGIFSYLCLPIRKKILISYILISDFLSVWIWGCLFAYFFIFYQCSCFFANDQLSVLTTSIAFFIFILCNNYLVYLIKAFLKGFAILLFPVCLGLVVCIQLLFLNLNSIIGLIFSCILLFAIIIILRNILKYDLYKELNNFAC